MCKDQQSHELRTLLLNNLSMKAAGQSTSKIRALIENLLRENEEHNNHQLLQALFEEVRQG